MKFKPIKYISKDAYGLPYKGSKNIIAKRIIDKLPAADVFVDLFSGGGAITHCALLSGKFKKIIINDINGLSQVFCNSLLGFYNDKFRWVSRENFKNSKEFDPIVKYCYSFGTGGGSYIFSKELEDLSYYIFEAIVYNNWYFVNKYLPEIAPIIELLDPDKRPVNDLLDLVEVDNIFKRHYIFDKAAAQILTDNPRLVNKNILYLDIRYSKKPKDNPHEVESLRSLRCIGSFKRFVNISKIKSNCQVISLQKDYREVEIPAGAVVYCDPPYNGTSQYNNCFDSQAFFNWARGKKYYISELNAPFECLGEIKKREYFSVKKDKSNIEKLYLS